MRIQDGFLFQFYKLAGPFWSSKNQFEIRKDTGLFVILTALQIYIAVIITEWNADLFDALEQHSMSGIIAQIGMLVLIFVGSIAITTWHLIVKRRLLIGWRIWLTEKVISKWMHKGRHYQITFMAKNNHDNPDVRIAEDIRIATEEAIGLGHSLFYSLLLLGSFTKILWTLSGTIVLNLGLFSLPIAGYLVWISIIYSICASILGWWTGKPLTEATNARQSEEANYRYGLIKAQEHSQSIALIHGEDNEQKQFRNSFQPIIDTYQLQTDAWKQIQIFTSGYSITSMGLPLLVAAPRYIVGAISLGTLMQSVQAFQQMVSALSWPVNNMPGIASWRASVERVLGLVKALDELENDISCLNSHQICVGNGEKSVIKFDNVSIANLEGQTISLVIDNEIKAGEHVLISGKSSTGAMLFQAIAGLWPWGTGHIQLPENERLFFMSPRPYLPTGSLYSAICYPKPTTAFKRPDLEKLLRRLGLKELINQLDRVESWDKLLSREQQQRLGLVRVLLYQPKWIFIQEALDSLTPDGEKQMLELLSAELPNAAILSITNQPSAEAFHQRKLKI
ncbi:ABC-type transport system, permease and ATPase component [Methyloglobulus morosus KoM1]|uniref:ABC-type transport system, permease and ATPase component n=1 Tax=Methyloglobulus morosus KoM1 TaxID=1116472 RepID=V5BDY1_9GAMM|nr:ABC transporter ATP-binding protein/permease [Methyloglobulus morosus]ESS71515.1 ABC-type transport system, permease and ATPase component [Methyloglobulus morosus KoM1]